MCKYAEEELNQAVVCHPVFFDPLNKHVEFVSDGNGEKMTYVDHKPGTYVYPDGKVEFNIYAPGAKKVEVAGITGSMKNEKIQLLPQENGYFSVIADNIKPGFHYYDCFVDDVLVRNPDGMICYGCFNAVNFFEIPGEKDDFYFLKDVPHGDVRIEQYRSSVTGNMKGCIVYTPPGYNALSDEKYPVLYLQHGVGENETGWIWNGKVNFILDNLMAEGKCRKMIVVMNSGYAFKKGENPVFFPGDFDTELVNDCIPFIEKNYRILKNRQSRAIAGLSLGSAQATVTALKHPDLFGSLGVFSGICADELRKIMADNIKYEYIFLSSGKGEGELPGILAEFGRQLNTYGIKCDVMAYDGFHEWSPWRNSLRDFASNLFRNRADSEENIPPYTSAKDTLITDETYDIHSLYGDILFYHPEYKEVVFAADDKGNPAGTYRDIPKGVEITGKGKAKFHFFAPKAKNVEVNILGMEPVALTKEADGLWEKEVENIEPGFHYFHMSVNGTDTINSQAPVGYGCFKAMNYFEMPDEHFDSYMLKDIPHGVIHMNYYKSSQTGRTKICYVYTPAGYDTSCERYPVLYLQHGGGENENGWVYQGKAGNIMDDLIEKEKCKKMILVMTTGYSFRSDGTSHPLLGSVEDEIVNDLIPFIDSRYRTLPDKKNRAMAGLSMGGMQTQKTVFHHLDIFANAGIFSGGLAIKDDEDDYTPLFSSKQTFHESFDCLFTACAEQDGLYNPTKENVQLVKEKYDIDLDFYHIKGYHDWTFWRHCLYEFVQKIF